MKIEIFGTNTVRFDGFKLDAPEHFARFLRNEVAGDGEPDEATLEAFEHYVRRKAVAEIVARYAAAIDIESDGTAKPAPLRLA